MVFLKGFGLGWVQLQRSKENFHTDSHEILVGKGLLGLNVLEF